MPRYAGRRDSNEGELVATAERLGWWLIKLNEPCDWLGARHGVWYPIEIKGEKGALTAKQEIWHRDAANRNAPILIWRTIDDVLKDTRAK